MALRFVTTSIINTTTYALNLGTTDSAYVALGGLVGSAATTALNGDGANHHVTVLGGVYGVVGIYLGGAIATSGNQWVYVGEGGTVGGEVLAIHLVGTASTVENYGQIFSAGRAFLLDTEDGVASNIWNYGTITAGTFAVTRSVGATSALDIHNFGTISGGTAVVSTLTSESTERVYNRGTLNGDLSLGGGEDLYDGRGGTMNGHIYGGSGYDVFIPGNDEETIDGGGDMDTVVFITGPGVKVALDGSFANTGRATNDTYSGIESLTGTTFGKDYLRGDSGGNSLYGLGGADTLDGADGNDTLGGGNGHDVLIGGAGADMFRFQNTWESSDTITDFDGAAGQDIIAISRSGFGLGLDPSPGLLASQFQSRGGHGAQTAEVRFMFDSNSTGLWFDADGNGTVFSAVLVADLQAGAILTLSSILML